MAESEKAPEVKWTSEELQDQAQRFEATPEEIAGAIHLAGGNKKYYTDAEATKSLKAFREREV
jgi:hypothetical protein